MKQIVFILFFFTAKICFGQNVIGCQPNNIIINNTATCLEQSNFTINQNSVYTITYAPNGNLYFTDLNVLYSFNTYNQVIKYIYEFPIAPIDQIYTPSSLGCSSDGTLVFGGRGIATYNIYSGLYSELGELPNNLLKPNVGFGDFFYFNNNLYLATANSIILIDLSNPNNSTIHSAINLSEDEWIGGATTINTSCDSSVVVFSTTKNNLFNFDMNTKSLSHICKIESIYDLASPLEFLSSDCELTVDLDIDNSGGTIGGDYDIEGDCGPIELPLSDMDVDVYSQYGPVDSIRVWLTEQVEDAEEFMMGPLIIPTLRIDIHSPDFITIVNRTGAASFDDFKDYIRDLRYHHTLRAYTPGDRAVLFQAFSEGHDGDTVRCTIHLKEQAKAFAGRDTTFALCRSIGVRKVTDYLQLPVEGMWHDGVDSFDTGVDDMYDFAYSISDTNCLPDTAFISIAVVPPPTLDIGLDTTLCKLIDFELTASGNFNTLEWDDGSSASTYVPTNFGYVYAIASSGEGCSVKDSVLISQVVDTIFIEKDTFICSSSSLIFNQETYTVGDTLKQFLPSLTSCDSLLFVFVKSSGDMVRMENNIGICRDSVFVYEGNTYAIGDTISEVKSGSGQDCDTLLLSYIVEDGHAKEVFRDTTLCVGEYIVVQGMRIDEEGDFVFKENNDDCGIITYVHVEFFPETVIDIEQDPSGILNTFDSVTYSITGDQNKIMTATWNYSGALLDSQAFFITEQLTENENITLFYTDENNCMGFKTIATQVQENVIRLYIPSAFSPNEDNINDTFSPVTEAGISSTYTLTVFNRWGNKVFEGIDRPWNGTFKGEILSPDTYSYFIKWQPQDGRVQFFSGEVVLVK